jgi:predicted dehydrogenase
MIDVQTLGVRSPTALVRPRLGFAGVGWIGRNRMEAIAESGRGNVVAIFDPVSEAARSASAVAPAASVVNSYEELLSLDLDGVVIATPNALHAEQAIAALNRGLAVFCQKPLGRNLAETREVITVAREADRLLQVDLSYRFTAGMRRIRELIRSGTLGRIYAVEAVFHNAYGPDKPWFYDASLSGGGCLLDLGVHLVDLTLWCLDYPAVSNVVGHLLNRASVAKAHGGHADNGNGPVEDYAAAQLLLATGTSVQLACSWRAPAGRDADIRLTFFGAAGGAQLANVDGSFFHFTAEQFTERTRHPLVSAPDAWGGRAAIDWCERLGESAAFDPEIEHLSLVAETLDRIYGRLP